MYIPFKITTDYTLLNSLIKIKDLIIFCNKNNIKTCGICDTNLYGSIEFYKLCIQNNIKPLIGLEVIIDNKSIYLYAMNYDGYKNLLKINSLVEDNLVTLEVLTKYSDNIIAIIPYKSISFYEKLSFYKYIYLSYQNDEELRNELVKTNKVIYLKNLKYLNKEDYKYYKYLKLLNEEKTSERDENSYLELVNLSDIQKEELNNLVSLLNVTIPFNKRYIPSYLKDGDSFTYLSNLCLKGLKKRLNNVTIPKYLKRLKYELAVIKKMGFVDYFLIVYDYVLYAKKHNILVGPGRGSAAGSLVSYVIGITDIDPLKYDLLFERFLNYERVTMPDIDIDFDNTKREEVINYVKEKYGSSCVAGGMTYATLKTRLVLRDVGKILKIDEHLLNKFLKEVNRDITLEKNLLNPQIKEYLKRYKELSKLYEISLKLEGLKRNISTHAAGVVIASVNLDEIIPMYKKKDVYLTGCGMEYLEDLGLLKMDFLALKNLSTIAKIINNIENFSLREIPLDDRAVYKLFSEAETEGIFQFETNAFKNILPKLKPNCFEDLIAAVALIRPGPSKELETYIKRKEGLEKVSYYHEDLKEILKETYGVIIYQEQVINILVKMASFSFAEADNVRYAMAKKKSDLLLKWKDKFVSNALKNGYDINLINNIYNHILSFASYGFNKAHSVSYALVSYQMAYLKVHYPHLFIFSLLDNVIGSSEKIKIYLGELKKNGQRIENVNINYSELDFVIHEQKVYLPFKVIKNLKREIGEEIVKERANGFFQSVFDFFKRMSGKITKNEYVMLIKAGAFKDFYNMQTMMNNLDVFINYGLLYKDLGEYALIPEIEKTNEYPKEILREFEILSYGFFVTNHPASQIVAQNVMKSDKLQTNVFKNVQCYVMIEDVKKIKTKKNEDMAFLRVSDEIGNFEVTVFPNIYKSLTKLKNNDMIRVWGKVVKRYDKYNVVATKIEKV